MASLCTPSEVFACSTCELSDPPPAALSQASTQPWRLALEARTWVDQLGDPRQNGVLLEELRTSLSLTHSGPNGWGGSVRLPLVARQVTQVNLATTRVVGPGDLEVQAHVRAQVLRSQGWTHALSVEGGLTLPSAPLLSDNTGAVLVPEAQVGAGAWTPSLGVVYQAGRERLLASVRLEGILPGPGYLEEQGGAALRGSGQGLWRPFSSLDLGAGMSMRWERPGLEGGVVDPDSGGAILFATAQIRIRPLSGLELYMGYAVPLLNALSGYHLEAPSLTGGASYGF